MGTTNGDVPHHSQHLVVSALGTFLESEGIRDRLVDVWAGDQQLAAKIEQDLGMALDATLRCTKIDHVEALQATIVSMQQGHQTFAIIVEDDGTVIGASRTAQVTTASAAPTSRASYSSDHIASI